MNYLLDTSAISDLMQDRGGIRARLAAAATDRVCTCTIVRGEILHGIARLPDGKRKLALQDAARQLFAVIECAAIPVEAAEHYSRIKLERQSSGQSLDENDLWIAATAATLNATLVTRDTDFNGIDRLTTEDWTR